MPNPFDEIKQDIERKRKERERQLREERLREERREATKIRFAREIALIAPMINQVLREFGDACWVKDYRFHPLAVESDWAYARVQDFFVRVHPNYEDGSIFDFTFGAMVNETSENLRDYPVERDCVRLEKSTISRKEVEQALLKTYKLVNGI